jgi:hypothetical protein
LTLGGRLKAGHDDFFFLSVGITPSHEEHEGVTKNLMCSAQFFCPKRAITDWNGASRRPLPSSCTFVFFVA